MVQHAEAGTHRRPVTSWACLTVLALTAGTCIAAPASPCWTDVADVGVRWCHELSGVIAPAALQEACPRHFFRWGADGARHAHATRCAIDGGDGSCGQGGLLALANATACLPRSSASTDGSAAPAPACAQARGVLAHLLARHRRAHAGGVLDDEEGAGLLVHAFDSGQGFAWQSDHAPGQLERSVEEAIAAIKYNASRWWELRGAPGGAPPADRAERGPGGAPPADRLSASLINGAMRLDWSGRIPLCAGAGCTRIAERLPSAPRAPSEHH